MIYDAVIIGGGVNGLTCAAMLAKRGLRTVLIEARAKTGGCAALVHSASSIRRDVVEELQLQTFGVHFMHQPIEMSALSPDGRALVIWQDDARTAEGLRAWSAKDAERWHAFRETLFHLGSVIGTLFMHTPPSVDDPGGRDAWSLVRTLGVFRGIPKADQWRLLRWGPMAAADLVSECFETELLRATLAADGIFGAMLGPWSAGSGLQMLLSATNHRLAWPGGNAVAGGAPAVVGALRAAAERFGAEIRTGSPVSRIEIADGRANGVMLATGERIDARNVVSGVDPRRTFLSLCDADHLPPEFSWRMKHYRSRGTLAKVNLVLGAAPAFAGATREMLASRVRLAPDLDYLERAFDHAKYGRFSPHPWIEFTVGDDNVLSAYAQFAPYTLRDQDWDAARQPFGEAVLSTLEQYAPDIRSLVVASEVITPLDLEREFGLTGGQIFHGELSLDQFFTMRPLLGYGQHRSPVRGLYLCGSGSHPGTGLTGGSGANAAKEIARDL
ncbi:MAG: NAD(P)/FAD-dependent oxidoreductase [Vicinamibacterales bacterium]